MRGRPLFLLCAASVGAALLVAVQACVGDDPVTSGPPADAAGSDANGDDGGHSDAAPALRIEPASVELAPGAVVSIKISGGTPGAAVTLSVGNTQAPDGGAAASGVSLTSSSAILSPTGEASVDIRAASDATQHRFDVTVAGGASPAVVPGRVIGKPGTVDAFFGDHGGFFDFFTADTGDTTANSVLVQPDGKFIVGGTGKGYQELLIARFTADGALDTSFATNGFVLVPGARSPQMARASDGSIVIAAAAPNNPKLFRLTAAGAFAPGWGGAAGIDPGLAYGTPDPAFAVTNDAALIAGHRTAPEGVAIKKYLADGGLDPSFGAAGVASFTIGLGVNAESDRPFALTVDPTNGDIWASGSYYPGANPSKSWVRGVSATGVVQAPSSTTPRTAAQARWSCRTSSRSWRLTTTAAARATASTSSASGARDWTRPSGPPQARRGSPRNPAPARARSRSTPRSGSTSRTAA
jgi:uncharacterized delta-60 repeat protein